MDQKNDEVRLELDLGLSLSSDYYPKKRDNKRKAFVGDLSIPLHTTKHEFSSNIGDDDQSEFEPSRKKLRLTRDQITLLEDSFKQQTTLNTALKETLAVKLNLKPRQVEVWFQNRRARTKLKKTEVDCEFLKAKCERLSEENWRLKKEVMELRSLLKAENPPSTAAAPHFLYHNQTAEKNKGGG